jgi:drug/metabolite transporter (DMT)-like permease
MNSQSNKFDFSIIFSLIILYFAWGSTYLAIHFVVQSCPPIIASGFRNFFAGAAIWLWLFFTNKEKKVSYSDYPKMIIAGFLMLTIGNGLLTIAAAWVPSGYMSLFPALVPAWIVIIQFFMGTKPNGITIAGLILGFIGMFFLVNQEQLSIKGHEDNFGLGVVFLLLASIGWSCGVMYSISNPLSYSTAKVSSIQMISGGLLSLVLSSFIGEWPLFDPSKFTVISISAFFYLLVVGSIVGFLVFSYVSKKASPTLVSTYSYVNPLVAIFLGWAFAGEQFSVNMMIAALFIITAVVLITFGTSKK